MKGGPLRLGRASEAVATARKASTLDRLQRTDRLHGNLRVLGSTVAFWGAILLPALYLPLLLQGLESLTGLGLFLALFGLHLLALIAGRRRHR